MGIFGGLKSGANIDPSMLSKLSFGDRARLFAIGMNDPSAAMQMKQQMQIRPAQQAFMSNLEKRLGPQYAETQGAGAAIQAPSMPGMPQAEAAPEYEWQAPQRTSDGLNINSPELGGIAMQAERLGVPITTLLDVLKAQKPDIAFTPSNEAYDKGTGRLTGMVAPKTGEGQTLRRDASGGIASIENAPNYTRALMESEAAKTTGQEGAKAAYDMISVDDGNGGKLFLPRSAVLQAAAQGGTYGKPGGMGYTPPASELAAAQTRAVGAATGDVERQQGLRDRISQAPSQLSALNQMRANLPNVISGFGSDIKLNTARAMAAAGNEDAKRKVVATETFLNQGRILVAGIIKAFGANPTEGERKYAEKMSSADAELNAETMAEGIRLQTQRIYRDYASAGIAPPPAPAAPRQAAQRVRNEVYQTPRGPLVWTGTGWMQP
jgi:hypothetical protein